MKSSPNHALREALSLLQETARSPFTTDELEHPRSQMANLEELFLVNLQMRRENLDRWIRLLNQEVERRAEGVRERRIRQARAAESAHPRMRAAATRWS